jgi:hypothetical protein
MLEKSILYYKETVGILLVARSYLNYLLVIKGDVALTDVYIEVSKRCDKVNNNICKNRILEYVIINRPIKETITYKRVCTT